MEEIINYDAAFHKYCWDEYCKIKRGADFLGIIIEDFGSWKESNTAFLAAEYEIITTNKVVH